jgi:hypothetical protein
MKEDENGEQQPSGAEQCFGLALSAGRLPRGNGTGIEDEEAQRDVAS